MPVKCNMINLIGLFQNITKFVIAECKPLKILKKTLDLKFLSYKEHKLKMKSLRCVYRNSCRTAIFKGPFSC